MESRSRESIIIVVPSLGIGGQEKIAITTAKLLLDYYTVKIVVFQRKNIEYNCNVEVIDINIPTKNGIINKLINQLKRARELKKIRRMIKPEAVISFGRTANITNVLSKRKNNGKTISSIHGFAEIKKDIETNLIMKKSDSVICISKAMHYELLKIYNSHNTIVIENGYDISKIINNNEKIDLKKFNLKEDNLKHPIFITMGRLEKVKAIDRIIKAFSKFFEKNKNSMLFIIGEGSQKNNLINLVKSLKLDDNVIFLGYLENPFPILKMADVYLLSSNNEGFPNSLIEALCCKLPIIALDCLSGPCEILSQQYNGKRIDGIKYEKYGVLIEESKNESDIIENIANGMNKLMADKGLLEKYRDNAIECANKYSMEIYLNKILDLIKSD